MSWTAAVDYRQGRLHRESGVPCQDFGRLAKPSEDLLIGAIADGAGSAGLGHRGARTAVSTALAFLQERLAAEPDVRGDPAGGQGGAEALFDGLLRAVRIALEAEARAHGQAVESFATTLLAFAAGPRGVAAYQIGDGWLVCRMPGADYLLLSRPQRGEYANETVFVTSPEAESAQTLSHHSQPVQFVCAATDGLSDVSIERVPMPEADRPHEAFFRPLDRFIAETHEDSDAHHAIRTFLRSDRLQARVEDDVTLMLGGWHPAGRA